MARWPEYQQSSWADRVGSQLEEKLPAILQEIEIRAHLSELQRLAKEKRRSSGSENSRCKPASPWPR
jgi:hypothetical protein